MVIHLSWVRDGVFLSFVGGFGGLFLARGVTYSQSLFTLWDMSLVCFQFVFIYLGGGIGCFPCLGLTVGKPHLVVVVVQGAPSMCHYAAKLVGFLAHEAYTSTRGKYATVPASCILSACR